MENDDHNASQNASQLSGMTIRELLLRQGAKESDLYSDEECEARFKDVLQRCLTKPRFKARALD